MRKEFSLAIVVIILIGVAAFAIMGRNQSGVPQNLAVDTSQEPSQNKAGTQENTVIYTNAGYSPSELAVKTGTTVAFVNESDLPMWTASNPHPVHTDHAQFDHRRGVSGGETYQFSFTEPGTHTYHNHLSPQHTGTIIVE